MSPIAFRALRVAVPLTAGAAIAALVSRGTHALVLDVYLLALAAVVLLALVRTTRAQAPADRTSQFDRALAHMRRPPAESGELSLVRDLELSSISSLHFHTRLRPVLREVGAHRLRTHYGVDLDSEPTRARELVGAAGWDAIQPDRPPPADRLAPGPALSELLEIVEDIERC